MNQALRSISMTRALAAVADRNRCEFLVGGEPEQAVLVMAPEVFLPVVALHADAKCRELLGLPLPGMVLRDDPDAMFGVYADVEPASGDEASTVRTVFFLDAARRLFGMAENVTIECAPIFEVYRGGLLNHMQDGGQVSWPLARVSPR